MTNLQTMKSILTYLSLSVLILLSTACGGQRSAENFEHRTLASADVAGPPSNSIVTTAAATIVVDGLSSDWQSIASGANATGQSVTEIKAVYDGATALYFLAQGSRLGANYNLFINSDGNASTGFIDSKWSASGADYLLENGVLYKYKGTGTNWAWTSLGRTGVTHKKTSLVFEAKISVSALVNVVPAAVKYAYRDLNASYAMVSQLPKLGSTMASVSLISTTSTTLVVDQVNGPYRTIAAAMNNAVAGTTIVVRAGVYKENVNFMQSGRSDAYLSVIGDVGAIIDGTGMDGRAPLVTIDGKSYVRFKGFTLRNLKPSLTTVDATAVLVVGAATGVEILNNDIHDIWASSSSSAVNAHGILVLGNSNPGINNVKISGNKIHHMKTGWSENLTLNGNVDGFEVSFNTLYDNNNIGIDIAGGYGEGPVGYDVARNGVVVGNIIYNISSINNPAYQGVRAAGGIYIDGGQSVTIEQNRVDNSDIGIELASEQAGKSTKDIIVRNNFVSRSYQGNIQVGGYDANRGSAVNISIVNNTSWGSQTSELVIQFNTTNLTVVNNIFYALSTTEYIAQWGSNNAGVLVDNNIYYGANSNIIGDWPDARAKFVNPLLVNGYVDMHLQINSPAKNLGVLANYGQLDIDGRTRTNGVVDIGAHEL